MRVVTPQLEPVELRHRLVGDPRLSIAELARLGAGLAPDLIEQHRADLPVLHPSGRVTRIDGAVDRVLATLTDHCRWVMLRGLAGTEVDVSVSSVGQPWMDASAAAEGGVTASAVNVFVASPQAVVPAHIDFEHNVLLQLEGTKRVIVGVDAPAVIDPQVEQCARTRVRNLAALPDRRRTFELTPGTGLYLPPCTPHWVVGAGGVSVSVSYTWTTRWSDRALRVRALNSRLRRLGLSPATPTGGRPSDLAKLAALVILRQGRRVISTASDAARGVHGRRERVQLSGAGADRARRDLVQRGRGAPQPAPGTHPEQDLPGRETA